MVNLPQREHSHLPTVERCHPSAAADWEASLRVARIARDAAHRLSGSQPTENCRQVSSTLPGIYFRRRGDDAIDRNVEYLGNPGQQSGTRDVFPRTRRRNRHQRIAGFAGKRRARESPIGKQSLKIGRNISFHVVVCKHCFHAPMLPFTGIPSNGC